MPGVTSLIVGADSTAQIDEAGAALQVQLPPEIRADLEAPYQKRILRGLD